MTASMIAGLETSTPTLVFARLVAIRQRDAFRVVSLREEDQDLVGIADVRQCFQVDATAPALALRAACDQASTGDSGQSLRGTSPIAWAGTRSGPSTG